MRPGLRVALAEPPSTQYHVPGVDATFASVAEVLGAASVGVLLTGMGRDGAVGLATLRQAGAFTIGQDEATSVVWGMPAAAQALDAVDVELPLPEIAAAIVKAVDRVSPAPGDSMSPVLADADFQALRRYLRQTAGLEFDDSRRTSLAHVMTERLRVSGATDMSAYLALLDRPAGGAERQLLLDAVTIQETFFHRARPQIDALRDHLLPDVLQRAARQGRKVTVWSAGCSTGEEAYTLAMLALEATERMADPPPVRVVGTDVSTRALEVARQARYAGRTIDLAEPGAVARWLRPTDDGTFVVRDEVRELVEFAHHNLVIDPLPFAPGTVDLVVCRNVTIYFSRETTKALVGRFRDALVGEGWLLMGPAETLWQLTDAFTLVPTGEAFAYRPVAAALATPRVVEVAPAPRPAPRLRAPGRAPPRCSGRSAAPSQVRPPADVTPRPVGPGRAGRCSARRARHSRPPTTPRPPTSPSVRWASTRCSRRRTSSAVRHAPPSVRTPRPCSRSAGPSTSTSMPATPGSCSRARSLAPGDRLGAARAYRAAAEGLQHAPVESGAPAAGWRAVGQLVQLCRRLADDLEGPIDGPAAGVAAGAESLRRGA